MVQKNLAEADAGDFHFELQCVRPGQYECIRTVKSDPLGKPDVITDLREIPKLVFEIFNKAM
jgi:hypothetical protein